MRKQPDTFITSGARKTFLFKGKFYIYEVSSLKNNLTLTGSVREKKKSEINKPDSQKGRAISGKVPEFPGGLSVACKLLRRARETQRLQRRHCTSSRRLTQ